MIRREANSPSVGCLQSCSSPRSVGLCVYRASRSAVSQRPRNRTAFLMQRRIPCHSHIQEAVTPDRLPAVFPRGRRCRSCKAQLSIYNDGDRCWPCHPEGRVIRGNRSKDDLASLQDFAELMEDVAA